MSYMLRDRIRKSGSVTGFGVKRPENRKRATSVSGIFGLKKRDPEIINGQAGACGCQMGSGMTFEEDWNNNSANQQVNRHGGLFTP